jgi:hypothetical protein
MAGEYALPQRPGETIWIASSVVDQALYHFGLSMLVLHEYSMAPAAIESMREFLARGRGRSSFFWEAEEALSSLGSGILKAFDLVLMHRNFPDLGNVFDLVKRKYPTVSLMLATGSNRGVNEALDLKADAVLDPTMMFSGMALAELTGMHYRLPSRQDQLYAFGSHAGNFGIKLMNREYNTPPGIPNSGE